MKILHVPRSIGFERDLPISTVNKNNFEDGEYQIAPPLLFISEITYFTEKLFPILKI